MMRESIDKVNHKGRGDDSRETSEHDVLELIHSAMHRYRARQYRVLRDGPHDITHMDSRVLGYFDRHPGATQSDLAAHSGGATRRNWRAWSRGCASAGCSTACPTRGPAQPAHVAHRARQVRCSARCSRRLGGSVRKPWPGSTRRSAGNWCRCSNGQRQPRLRTEPAGGRQGSLSCAAALHGALSGPQRRLAGGPRTGGACWRAHGIHYARRARTPYIRTSGRSGACRRGRSANNKETRTCSVARPSAHILGSLALLAAPLASHAADIVLKASHQFPGGKGDVRDEMVQMIARDVNAAKVGVEIKVFPGSTVKAK